MLPGVKLNRMVAKDGVAMEKKTNSDELSPGIPPEARGESLKSNWKKSSLLSKQKKKKMEFFGPQTPCYVCAIAKHGTFLPNAASPR